MLIFAERWADALEVFRAIGVHARSFPWGYVGIVLPHTPSTPGCEKPAGTQMTDRTSRTASSGNPAPLGSCEGEAWVPCRAMTPSAHTTPKHPRCASPPRT